MGTDIHEENSGHHRYATLSKELNEWDKWQNWLSYQWKMPWKSKLRKPPEYNEPGGLKSKGYNGQERRLCNRNLRSKRKNTTQKNKYS